MLFRSDQAPLSMDFPRQESWGGLPFPSLGELPSMGIEPRSPVLKASSSPSESLEKTIFNEYVCVYNKHMHCIYNKYTHGI